MELLRRRQQIEAEIGNRQQQEGLDDEYEIEQVLSLCILELIGKAAVASNKLMSLSAILVQSEIDQEIAVTFLDDELICLLKSYSYKKLHIISDFYMSAEKVRTILQAHSFPFSVDTFFLSCDIKLNKRSGRLFSHVLATLGIESEKLLHIGDNQFADVEMAEKSGVKAYHFIGANGEVARRQHQAFFSHRLRENTRTDLLLSKKPADPLFSRRNLNREQERIRQYGRYLSPLFTGFALYILERCLAGGHKVAYFFTREGKFFQRIFDHIQPYGLYGMSSVKSQLLPVSRLATFFPSLSELKPKKMMRLWSQYHTQSVNSFLGSLGEDPQDYLASIRECNVDPQEMISEPWKNKVFLRLFANRNFLELLQKNQRIRKESLLNFFGECGFGRDEQALIVDIGWRGTIQDNLAFIFPDVTIDGCYLGLQKFFNSQPHNTQKYAYIANSNKNEYHVMLKHVMPFEMLCFGTGGSATGYQKTDSGSMTPEFHCDSEEDRIHNDRIHYFQKGVIEGVAQVCKTVSQHGISLRELRIEARLLASDFLLDPPVEMCRAFCALKQDDTFGMARTIFPGDSSFRFSDRILTYISPARRARLLADLEESGWPQGLLRSQYFGIFHLLSILKNKVFAEKFNKYGKGGVVT